MKRRPSRARRRGVTSVSTILESAMVMGWFVVLLLAEKGLSSAAEARRSAESAAEESAVTSSAAYCEEGRVTTSRTQVSPSVSNGAKPRVGSALGIVQALGLGGERTFALYLRPTKDVSVRARANAEAVQGDVNPADKTFEGSRRLGCLERSLDVPRGSLGDYRTKLWETNLKGY